jgi:hypothetical protein
MIAVPAREFRGWSAKENTSSTTAARINSAGNTG